MRLRAPLGTGKVEYDYSILFKFLSASLAIPDLRFNPVCTLYACDEQVRTTFGDNCSTFEIERTLRLFQYSKWNAGQIDLSVQGKKFGPGAGGLADSLRQLAVLHSARFGQSNCVDTIIMCSRMKSHRELALAPAPLRSINFKGHGSEVLQLFPSELLFCHGQKSRFFVIRRSSKI